MSLQLSHLRRRAGDLRRDGRQHLVLSPRSLGDLEIAQAQLVKKKAGQTKKGRELGSTTTPRYRPNHP